MSKVAIELDQQLMSEVSEGYGTLSIRVVVVTPKQPADEEQKSVNLANEFDEEDEPDDDTKGSPLSSYLEKKSYGKWCTVFLINGQRHDAWDNAYISRDLEFKFLRDRMMVIVDLDGLSGWIVKLWPIQGSGSFSHWLSRVNVRGPTGLMRDAAAFSAAWSAGRRVARSGSGAGCASAVVAVTSAGGGTAVTVGSSAGDASGSAGGTLSMGAESSLVSVASMTASDLG
jgi:hypothetical protein